MAVTQPSAPYNHVDGAQEADSRADLHRREALDRLARSNPAEALVHALLALESRLDEATWYLARLA